MSAKIMALTMLGLTLAAPLVEAGRGRSGGRSSFSRAGRIGTSSFRTGRPHHAMGAGKHGKSTGFAKSAGGGRTGRALSPHLRRGLIRQGLARSFYGFHYRYWDAKWRCWLFYNPLDGGWYFYSGQCSCWLPSKYMAYDPPTGVALPQEVSKVWKTSELPVNNPPVNPPPSPSNIPPPVPGVGYSESPPSHQ